MSAGQEDPARGAKKAGGLSSVRAQTIFAGRHTLYISEVADALRCSQQHVINLIIQGELFAANIAVKNGSSETLTKEERAKVPRACWRVPVGAYDGFLQRRSAA